MGVMHMSAANIHVGMKNVAIRGYQLRRIIKPYKDAQNRLLWRDKTCLART